jgi:hypothetical protein
MDGDIRKIVENADLPKDFLEADIEEKFSRLEKVFFTNEYIG